jgi:hypothetical protein
MSNITLPGFTGLSCQPEWLAERLRLADSEPQPDEALDQEEDPRTLLLLSALVQGYLKAVQALETSS